ncbi:hypothetical protein E2C01_030956 [Portunus trituberculatus]|uniref:Uncharacterized protein n=1 Tax=Portunus trituberculatus TaxID=210409 RepID=A0A5B7EVK6_PORTR|nr:hypothetical protein [Portunus trituberculatus]
MDRGKRLPIDRYAKQIVRRDRGGARGTGRAGGGGGWGGTGVVASQVITISGARRCAAPSESGSAGAVKGRGSGSEGRQERKEEGKKSDK